MLSILIWLPLLAAVIIAVLPNKINNNQLRKTAVLLSAVSLVLSLYLPAQYSYNNQGIQLKEFLPWIEIIGLNYNLGIDGLSLPLVVLNNLLIFLAIYSSDLQQDIGKLLVRPKLFYPLILILGGCINGALLAQNLLLFFIFYEIKLVPTYLLINIWGG